MQAVFDGGVGGGSESELPSAAVDRSIRKIATAARSVIALVMMSPFRLTAVAVGLSYAPLDDATKLLPALIVVAATTEAFHEAFETHLMGGALPSMLVDSLLEAIDTIRVGGTVGTGIHILKVPPLMVVGTLSSNALELLVVANGKVWS